MTPPRLLALARFCIAAMVSFSSWGCASSAERYRWSYIDESTFPSARQVVVQFPKEDAAEPRIYGRKAWVPVDVMVRETISQRQQWHARRASTLFDLERDSQIFVVYRPVDPDRPPAAGVPSPDLIPRPQQAEHPLRDGATEDGDLTALPLEIEWQVVTGTARAWVVDPSRVVDSGTITARRPDEPADIWMQFDSVLLGKMMKKVNDNSFTLVVRATPRAWASGPGSTGREPVTPGIGTFPLTRATVMDWTAKLQQAARAKAPSKPPGAAR